MDACVSRAIPPGCPGCADEADGHGLEAGESSLAESYLRRQLAIEPLAEAANRRLIELLASSDRRIAAIGHFNTYQELLQHEMQLDPGPETLALINVVRSGEVPLSEPASRSCAAMSWRRSLAGPPMRRFFGPCSWP